MNCFDLDQPDVDISDRDFPDKDLVMIKTILVPFVGARNDEAALQIAFEAAKLLNAHIEVAHFRPDVQQLIIEAAAYDFGLTPSAAVTPELVDALKKNVATNARQARHIYDDFCTRHDILRASDPRGVSHASIFYAEREGHFADRLTPEAAVHDLIAFTPKLEHSLDLEDIGDALVKSGRPALLAADKPAATLGRHVVIAWKQTAQAAHAVAAAQPFLEKAETVTILAAREDAQTERHIASAHRLAEQLRWSNITAAVAVLPESHNTGADLVDKTRSLGGDLLVMGAYGHSRARELIFGGVTRHVLHGVSVPVLLAH